MKTRSAAVKRIAATIALANGANWLRCPDARQAKRQAKYERLADTIIAQVENGMREWTWDSEQTTGE